MVKNLLFMNFKNFAKYLKVQILLKFIFQNWFLTFYLFIFYLKKIFISNFQLA